MSSNNHTTLIELATLNTLFEWNKCKKIKIIQKENFSYLTSEYKSSFLNCVLNCTFETDELFKKLKEYSPLLHSKFYSKNSLVTLISTPMAISSYLNSGFKGNFDCPCWIRS